MTRKQMKKYAQELTQCELIRSSETASKDDKIAAENRIMKLTSQIMMFPDGIDALLEIDSMCQSFLKNKTNNQGD